MFESNIEVDKLRRLLDEGVGWGVEDDRRIEQTRLGNSRER